jgi:subtilisin family serine protease
VIDSGVDFTHPDLLPNLWRNPGEVPGNGRDDDGNGFVDDLYGADFVNNDGTPEDDLGHGTHVAGIIGAAGNNGQGVTGVAWTTRVMALKFMGGAAGGFTSDAVRALDYAVANGARVVNASWGGPQAGADPTLSAAVGRARAAGVVIVAAAGNNAANTDAALFYPAGYTVQFDNVVSVAATDGADNLAAFSNYGPRSVTIAAPGLDVNSTLPAAGTGSRAARRWPPRS